MKYIIRVFLIAAFAPLAAIADDKLISYDQATSIITVERSGQLKTYRVKPIIELTINGAKAPIENLTPGMMVAITLSDPQTASRIAARGTTPAQFNGRKTVLKMRVDGTDIVRVRDGKLTIEHLEARKPESININGTAWIPTWNGKETEPFADFKPPLVPFAKAQVRFKQVSGRGKAQMEKGDFEKILTVRFDDGGGGADDYEIHVSW